MIALIDAVFRMKIGDVANSEWRGYGEYRSQRDLVGTLEKYYPELDPEEIVEVIAFRVERDFRAD